MRFKHGLALVGSLLLASGLGTAHAESNIVDLDVPDVELVDQDGKPGRFVSDLIGQNIAAVTFTFAHCTTICPTLDGIFKRLEGEIETKLDAGAVLFTVSVDPVNDIPERLKQRADNLEAGPGWNFLTGEKETVDNLLKALEVYTPDITEHPPTVFVIDGRRDVWTRLSGFPKPDKIIEIMESYRAARSKQGENVP